MITYISNLSGKIEAFLGFKNSLGIKYQAPRSHLKSLDRYNLNHENESTLTKDLVEGWAEYYAERSTTQDRSWASPIREFGRYLNIIGENEAYILDDRFRTQRYQAEVYTAENKMSNYERRLLRDWVRSGHSVYETVESMYLPGPTYPPMDFIDAYRFDRSMRDDMRGMTKAEKEAYLKSCMGWDDPSSKKAYTV